MNNVETYDVYQVGPQVYMFSNMSIKRTTFIHIHRCLLSSLDFRNTCTDNTD